MLLDLLSSGMAPDEILADYEDLERDDLLAALAFAARLAQTRRARAGRTVKFLVDAQLPRRVAGWLAAAGCDAVHTLDLADKNRTTDQQVIELADRENRVVVTKDADFVDSHVLHSLPGKLLLISTGNISNRDLEAVMVPLIPAIVQEFQTNSFLELGRGGVLVRG